MNLREAIGEYAVHYGRCQEMIGWEGEGAERLLCEYKAAREAVYKLEVD